MFAAHNHEPGGRTGAVSLARAGEPVKPTSHTANQLLMDDEWDGKGSFVQVLQPTQTTTSVCLSSPVALPTLPLLPICPPCTVPPLVALPWFYLGTPHRPNAEILYNTRSMR